MSRLAEVGLLALMGSFALIAAAIPVALVVHFHNWWLLLLEIPAGGLACLFVDACLMGRQ